MIAVRLAHTYELDTQTLATIRRLCADTFGRGVPGNFDDDDWDHALGGVHAIATEGEAIVAHAAVVQRRMLHGARALRTGYVEAVAVRPDRQRRGLGAAVMQALAPVIRGRLRARCLGRRPGCRTAVHVARLAAVARSDVGADAAGIERTPDDDDSTYVLPLETPLDLSGDLVCDWRDGDVW